MPLTEKDILQLLEKMSFCNIIEEVTGVFRCSSFLHSFPSQTRKRFGRLSRQSICLIAFQPLLAENVLCSTVVSIMLQSIPTVVPTLISGIIWESEGIVLL